MIVRHKLCASVGLTAESKQSRAYNFLDTIFGARAICNGVQAEGRDEFVGSVLGSLRIV